MLENRRIYLLQDSYIIIQLGCAANVISLRLFFNENNYNNGKVFMYDLTLFTYFVQILLVSFREKRKTQKNRDISKTTQNFTK